MTSCIVIVLAALGLYQNIVDSYIIHSKVTDSLVTLAWLAFETTWVKTTLIECGWCIMRNPYVYIKKNMPTIQVSKKPCNKMFTSMFFLNHIVTSSHIWNLCQPLATFWCHSPSHHPQHIYLLFPTTNFVSVFCTSEQCVSLIPRLLPSFLFRRSLRMGLAISTRVK